MNSALVAPEESLTAVVTLRLEEPWQTRLQEHMEALGFHSLWPRNPRDFEAMLPLADVALLHGNASPVLLGAPRLRWVHCGHAGLDGYLPSELFSQGFSLTSAAGRSAPALAEHALFLMMALAYDDNGLRRLRRWRCWSAPPPSRRRALHGRTLGILGMGHTGTLLAGYAHALGMRVICYRRSDRPSPPSVTRGFSAAFGDRLEDMLTECEFLVLASSLNDGTRHLIGASELANLPRGAFLVNVARGGLIDEEALRAALRSGHLGGAGLDVFQQEPLTPTSPFWSMDNVVISAHSPPRLGQREERHFRLVAENLTRFVHGERLSGELSEQDALRPLGPQSLRGRLDHLLSRAWARTCR